MLKRLYAIGVSAIFITLFIFLNGCALKPLNRPNSPISSLKPLLAPSSVGSIQEIKNKLVLTPAELHFINGIGHEFEDALMYEAYKTLFTSDYYAGNSVGDIKNFFRCEPKIDEAIEKQLKKLAFDIYAKYLKPEYSVEWTVTPFVVGVDCKQSSGIASQIPIKDEVPDDAQGSPVGFPQTPSLGKWIGFIKPASSSANPQWGGSEEKYIPFLNTTSREAFYKTDYFTMKSAFGHYRFKEQSAFACKYVFWDFPSELVKTPYYVVIPTKWSKLTSVRRFFPAIQEKDPLNYVHIAYVCDATEMGKMPLNRVILSFEQGLGFSVSVTLKRHSKVNEQLDKLKEKINSYNLVTAALSAEYGDPGRKVGSVIDSKLHSAIIDLIQKEYYADETIFTGSCAVEGKDFATQGVIVFKSKNYPPISMNNNLRAYYENAQNRKGYGDMMRNEFMFTLDIDSVKVQGSN